MTSGSSGSGAILSFSPPAVTSRNCEIDPVDVVRAAGDTRRAGILLCPVHPVWEAVIGDDVIELPGGLVVPGAPGGAAVQSEQRALVDAEYAPLRVGRIDPQLMVVVAPRSALHRHEGLAAIGRAIHRRVADIDHIRIDRIDGDAAEIPAALPDAPVTAHQRPTLSRVVGTVQASIHGIDQRKHTLRPRG